MEFLAQEPAELQLGGVRNGELFFLLQVFYGLGIKTSDQMFLFDLKRIALNLIY